MSVTINIAAVVKVPEDVEDSCMRFQDDDFVIIIKIVAILLMARKNFDQI